MSHLLSYLWLVFLVLYILSPLDAHPLFFDDLIASGILAYLFYKRTRQKRGRDSTYRDRQSQDHRERGTAGQLTLDEAYRTLGISRESPWEEVRKSYKEKIAQSHPDKVSHLSRELQDTARELTLKLNGAYELVKRHRGK